MSPFRRKGSPYLQVWPVVAGYGRVGPWSTGTKDERKARAMEAMLHELPVRGHGEVLGMIGKSLTLADVYVAHIEGRLTGLRALANDPPLSVAIERLRPMLKDERVRHGLSDLGRLAPKGARLSWVTDHKNVADALHAREKEGAKRNSVRRSLYRAICDLLKAEFGAAEQARVMSDVDFPTAQDERDTKLSAKEVGALLSASLDPLFECYVGLAVTSGIDRGPMLRIRPRDFTDATGELEVRDHKTTSRPRTLTLSPTAANYLRRAILLSKPGLDGRVFPWTTHMVRARWDATRERAGMEWLRLKDLRSVFADAFVRAGGTLKDLQGVLGHASGKTSMRYTRTQPVEQTEKMEAAARAMGFGARHLKIKETA